MKKTFGILCGLLLFLVMAGHSTAADVAKIGIIDFQAIMEQSSAGKIVKRQLNDKQKELVDKINDQRKQLNEFMKNLEREKLVLSKEQLNEKERTQRIRINDLKKMQDDSTRELKQLEFTLINDIQKKVFQISEKIGKADGYLLILEKRTSGVVYRPDHIDITDKVIKAYNLDVAKIKQ